MIRNATVYDAQQIARVHIDSWRRAYRGMILDSVLDELDVADRAERWVSILTSSDWPCFVAESKSGVVGFVHISSCRDDDLNPSEFGEITALYISPDNWRMGVGSKLLHSSLERLKELEFSKTSLWVLEENKQGRLFYEKHGFVADGMTMYDKRLSSNELRYCREL